MKQNIVKLSMVTAMFLTTGSYASQIIGADAGDTRLENVQFGYGGLNMDNVNVNLFTHNGNISTDTFDESDGSYTTDVMDNGDYYQSDVFSTIDPTLKLGFVTGKTWPISEPMGIKVVNNDTETNKYKPNNCIMASSYLGDENTTDPATTTHYLTDLEPQPTLCSSYAGSSKRFQLILNENMMTEIDQDGYGKSIDLVFNIDPASETGDHKYQVFQKVTNRTGMRLDGLKIQVLNSAGVPQTADLNISIGLGEGDPKESGDIWQDYEIAFYPPGLWGDGSKSHLPIGWFDTLAAGYYVDGNGTNTITTQGRLSGNYVEIYGNWLPNKWVGVGMHEDPEIVGVEPLLIAYWGTTPDQATDVNATPGWYYGMYNNDEVKTDFAPVSEEVLQEWANDLRTEDNPEGKYVIDDIEDLPNLSWNYIVNVGENISDKFIIRFTPKVSVDQTPPSYFDTEGNRIDPVLPAVDPTDPTDPTTSSGGGGGCTYNPNSKNFDLTMLMMLALSSLYAFRRRFIK